MKIYMVSAANDFSEEIEQALNQAGLIDTEVFIVNHASVEQVKDNISDAEIVVASPSGFKFMSGEHMDAMPNLKFVTTTSVGTDFIDLDAAKERGVVVSNEKGVNAEAVAEHCFAMILDLTKRITESDRGIREKGVFEPGLYTGFDLYQKTIGIIGTGDIGKRVARIATGFDMKVLGTNKSGREVSGFEIIDLESLLGQSDVVALTAPLNLETKNLLSAEKIDVMKPGSVLVSISREEMVDKDAVLKALENKKLFGFAFDADIGVPIDSEDPYLQHENIVITPHTASVTKESEAGYISMTVDNIKAFLGGKPIRVVNN